MRGRAVALVVLLLAVSCSRSEAPAVQIGPPSKPNRETAAKLIIAASGSPEWIAAHRPRVTVTGIAFAPGETSATVEFDAAAKKARPSKIVVGNFGDF